MFSNKSGCWCAGFAVFCVCVCVCHPKTVQGWTRSTTGAPSGQHHRGRATAERETQRSDPSERRAFEGRRGEPDGEWDKQEDTQRQSSRHTEQRGLRVPYKESGVGVESRQLSALLSKSSPAAVPPRVPVTKYGPTAAFKQTRLFPYLQMEAAEECGLQGAVLSWQRFCHLHQLRTVPVAVGEKTIFTSFHKKCCQKRRFIETSVSMGFKHFRLGTTLSPLLA